jgi:hypothetical protein
MGLDQYAAIRLGTKDEEGNWEQEELAYWRKHPHLQGFMERIYIAKGGFFFGDDSSDYYKEADLEFCENARKALADGQMVVYSSWW